MSIDDLLEVSQPETRFLWGAKSIAAYLGCGIRRKADTESEASRTAVR